MEILIRFAVKRVAGDGNCVFWSLEKLLDSDEYLHTSLRSKKEIMGHVN
jgi:hypothetical protein